MQEVSGQDQNGLTVTWSIVYPTAPTVVNMQLQGSMKDIDAQYQNLDASTNIAGDGPRMITNVNLRFLRAKTIQASGTSPAAIVKISI